VTILDEASYEGVIGTLYQGALDDAAWDLGLKSLASLVDGEGPLLMSINPATHALRRYQCYSYDPAVVSTYPTEWVSHDIRIAPSAFLEKKLFLSAREAQIAAELAAGLKPLQIAARLSISMDTLRAHLKACFAKTGCHTQSELVARISPAWGLSSTAGRQQK
jgi:DNA-binding CsgD family transcriptional regulator